ncbi:MAG: hypothetical protein ACQGVC_18325 [Myxococcota bacterium]
MTRIERLPNNRARMRKDTIVLVCTSEQTWQVLPRFCFNDNLMGNRRLFDLAVVCNGESEEPVEYLKQLSPEYLFVRPNLGRDPAAFDLLIRKVDRSYENYLFLHDDHWFADRDAFGTLRAFMDENPDVGAFGNLVAVDYYKPKSFESISAALGYGQLPQEDFPCFLQGMAGAYRRESIEALLRSGGVPHTDRSDHESGEVCERLVSFQLQKLGFELAQIPPGYETTLRHKDYPARPDSPNGLGLG